MRVFEMNWMQIEEYLKQDDRAVLPLGSTEQHGYLSLGTDAILAERVSVEAAEPLGVPVFPVLSYGISGYFNAFPGTVSLKVGTYLKVVRDLLDSLAGSGFRRILLVSGHGGNEPANNLGFEWMTDNPGVQVKFFQWWKGPKMMEIAKAIDPVGSHGSWFENFPWTRLPEVEVPAGNKALMDRSTRPGLVGEKLRQIMGDGNFGGLYQRPDDEMRAIWEAGVKETRLMITNGWDE